MANFADLVFDDEFYFVCLLLNSFFDHVFDLVELLFIYFCGVFV